MKSSSSMAKPNSTLLLKVTEMMEHILGRLDRQMELENCQVIFFLTLHQAT